MTEKLLPDNIKEMARISPNGEYAWRMSDIKKVIDSAQKIGLACLGGQPQFQLPEGICELYWINFDSTDKKDYETWNEYVERSAYEVKSEFHRRCLETDFKKEATEFDLINKKLNENQFDLFDYLFFVLYFEDENKIDQDKKGKDSSKSISYKKELKNKYRIMFSELTRIVNRNDPAGLLAIDQHDDEYSCEVTDILTGLRKCNSIEETCNLVSSVFNDAFDFSLLPEKYLDLAQPIWEWWQRQKNK